MVDKHDIENDEVDDVMDDDDVMENDAEVSLAGTERGQIIEDFSIASRQRLREELSSQVEAFLARGGKINEIPSAIGTGLTKKVSPDFGNRLIY